MSRLGAVAGALVLIGGVVGPANAELMDGATLEATFGGMSLVGIYEDGSWFSEIYAPDGSISYVDAAVGHHVGNWEVQGNTFCTFYVDMDGVCLTAEQIGPNCYFFAPPPPTKGREAVDTGTVLSWNALEPSTCDIAPVTAEPPAPGK